MLTRRGHRAAAAQRTTGCRSSGTAGAALLPRDACSSPQGREPRHSHSFFLLACRKAKTNSPIESFIDDDDAEVARIAREYKNGNRDVAGSASKPQRCAPRSPRSSPSCAFQVDGTCSPCRLKILNFLRRWLGAQGQRQDGRQARCFSRCCRCAEHQRRHLYYGCCWGWTYRRRCCLRLCWCRHCGGGAGVAPCCPTSRGLHLRRQQRVRRLRQRRSQEQRWRRGRGGRADRTLVWHQGRGVHRRPAPPGRPRFA